MRSEKNVSLGKKNYIQSGNMLGIHTFRPGKNTVRAAFYRISCLYTVLFSVSRDMYHNRRVNGKPLLP